MFIRVADNPERFVNTDLIECLTFIGRNQCALDFRSGRSLRVSEQAGRLLLEFSEANQALTEFTDIDSLPDTNVPAAIAGANKILPLHTTLTSQVAQHLRDNAPNGLALMDLVMRFPESDALLMDALDALLAEKVIVTVGGEPNSGTILRYYHASNVPRASSSASGF